MEIFIKSKILGFQRSIKISDYFGEYKLNPNYRELHNWNELKRHLNNRLDASKFSKELKCPLCGKSPEQLIWIEWRSSDWSWQVKAGKAGILSICEDCRIQVDYKMTRRS